MLGYTIVEEYRSGYGEVCNSNGVCPNYLRPFDAVHAWTFWVFPLVLGEAIVYAMRLNDNRECTPVLEPVFPHPRSPPIQAQRRDWERATVGMQHGNGNIKGGEDVGCGESSSWACTHVSDMIEANGGVGVGGSDVEVEEESLRGLNYLNVLGVASALACIGSTAGIFVMELQ